MIRHQMLTRETARNCRSFLFVPATNHRALAKAHQRGADVLIVDLEDAISEAEKTIARNGLATQIPALREAGARCIVVRVNRTPARLAEDIAAARGADAVLLPKVETPDDIAASSALARECGVSAPAILALLESPRAVLNAMAIADMEETVGIALGSEDLSVVMGSPPGPANLTLPCQLIALAAAASGGAAIGLPASLADYGDLDSLASAAASARGMAMTGAMCIHPAQVAPINRAFAPSPETIAWARRVCAAWHDAERQGKGTASINGTMIDLPVVARAKAILNQLSE